MLFSNLPRELSQQKFHHTKMSENSLKMEEKDEEPPKEPPAKAPKKTSKSLFIDFPLKTPFFLFVKSFIVLHTVDELSFLVFLDFFCVSQFHNKSQPNQAELGHFLYS